MVFANSEISAVIKDNMTLLVTGTRSKQLLAAVLVLLAVLAGVACSSQEASPPETAAASVPAGEPATTVASSTPTSLPEPRPTAQPEPTTAPKQIDAAATDLEGRWEGVTRIVALGELPFAVTFAVSDDGLGAAMDIQGNIGLELTNVTLDGQRIHFELESPLGLATWDGEVRDGVIDGEFTQGEAQGIFRLERSVEEETSRFRSDEVIFANGEIVLAGEVTLPHGDGPYPAVVLISGSGDQLRDSEVAGFKVFAVLADELAERGIASLRFDDRGVGGSGGDGLAATIEDRAADVEAALELLRSRDDIKADNIGLVGHSEGGMVAPFVANRSDGAAFVALLAAPAVPGAELLKTQQLDLLGLAGAPQDEIEQYQELQRLVFEAIATGQGWDQVTAASRALALQQVEGLSEGTRNALGDIDNYVDVIVSQELTAWQSPWFASFVDYDPSPAIAALRVPVMALFGELDTQVRADINATAISEAIAAGDIPGYAIATVFGANHLFQAASTGSPDEYDQLRPEFAPDFLDFLLPWLTEQVSPR